MFLIYPGHNSECYLYITETDYFAQCAQSSTYVLRFQSIHLAIEVPIRKIKSDNKNETNNE